MPAHSELFFDHRPMTLARWPNAGDFSHIAGYPAASDRVDEHGGNVGELPGGFHHAGDRPKRWKDVNDLRVHGYWSYDWANSYERVASLDVMQRLVKTAPPHGLYGFRKNQRFYFLNVLEELDQPGEWFLFPVLGTHPACLHRRIGYGSWKQHGKPGWRGTTGTRIIIAK